MSGILTESSHISLYRFNRYVYKKQYSASISQPFHMLRLLEIHMYMCIIAFAPWSVHAQVTVTNDIPKRHSRELSMTKDIPKA